MLESWFSISTGEPANIKNILHQYIMYNQHITNRTEIKIIDMIDNNGMFYKYQDLNRKFDCNLSYLFHRSIISAIPKRWKVAVKNICPLQNKGNLQSKATVTPRALSVVRYFLYLEF